MNSDLIKTTVGIAAFNAEKNIKHLLQALVIQKQTAQTIEQIVVYSDCSSDQTVQLAKEINDARILIVDSKNRSGFSGAVQQILKLSNSEFTVILNDDIKIMDDNFLDKLIQPYLAQENVGLISGNPQPMKRETLIESGIISTFRAYEKLRYKIRGGNNVFTCDGKVLGFSKAFVQHLEFPSNSKEAANVDAFVYFSCLSSGFKYRHAKDAVVYFKCPDNFHDYLKWTLRNNSEFYILQEKFGSIVDEENHKPILTFLYYTFLEFIKNPLGSGFIFLVNLYVKLKARTASRSFNPTWDVVSSTKNLDN